MKNELTYCRYMLIILDTTQKIQHGKQSQTNDKRHHSRSSFYFMYRSVSPNTLGVLEYLYSSGSSYPISNYMVLIRMARVTADAQNLYTP